VVEAEKLTASTSCLRHQRHRVPWVAWLDRSEIQGCHRPERTHKSIVCSTGLAICGLKHCGACKHWQCRARAQGIRRVFVSLSRRTTFTAANAFSNIPAYASRTRLPGDCGASRQQPGSGVEPRKEREAFASSRAADELADKLLASLPNARPRAEPARAAQRRACEAASAVTCRACYGWLHFALLLAKMKHMGSEQSERRKYDAENCDAAGGPSQ
jgi:hypothetical protein